MYPFRISTLLAVVAAGLIVSAMGFGQLPSHTSSGDIILEVFATHMSSEDQHSYVFLRVFTDGLAECESSKQSDLEHTTSKKLLTKDEYIKIKSVVGAPRLAKVGPRYERHYGIIDTSTEWRIEIHRTGQTQVIQVLEFSPGLARVMRHPYPDALVKLGCSVEKLRADVLGVPPILDTECKKVLGAIDEPKS